ncbi:hypothetical protein EMIHUDRAFT_471033 [Emiliania huxleyi CCMP1516]|uniref:T-complex protein 1 subunit delta n=2 Tax=Emiliania huxleyi TaxID=2903 RepID=A0A0D3ID01_EMIH1|nr:hypothetical protein EMIHUDRAFT_471033 [Emiliania huxleyi CCMP1516]EOD09136.1 hypothetical protein EMIHUDRAFT_471033 [Emiliania huxleyi CCMP1516]|eukprot:XP_005761565.1 hypothetical protein EMIHUDRAFT_471033 [Emiliania huxleyi CCMP1516]
MSRARTTEAPRIYQFKVSEEAWAVVHLLSSQPDELKKYCPDVEPRGVLTAMHSAPCTMPLSPHASSFTVCHATHSGVEDDRLGTDKRCICRPCQFLVVHVTSSSVRESNIVAAKSVADAISSAGGDVVITNDGATILKQMEASRAYSRLRTIPALPHPGAPLSPAKQVAHPTAKMLVDLSKSQDVEAGDGTTTVTDRILKEERKYILDMCKKVQKSGCNVLLIQKSILRDAVNDLSLHFLAKMKILVVKDIERDDVEFICKTCGCLPIANIDTFHPEKLGRAELVHEVSTGDGKIVRVTGVPNEGKTASNNLVLDESERSLHDALCVLRCLVKKRFLTPGGGAPEMRLSYELSKWADSLLGARPPPLPAARAPGRSPPPPRRRHALVVPYTLAENAGLDAIHVVTELRNKHAEGEKAAGINVRKGKVTNILEENVLVPLLVHTSAVSLATECVRLILKIDDIVITR